MINDPISLWLFYFHNSFLTYLSRFLDLFAVPIVFAFLFFIIVLSYWRQGIKLRSSLSLFSKVWPDMKKDLDLLKKRAFVFLIALLLTIAVVQFIKLVYPQDRPCVSEIYTDKIECPSTSSFPSTHTASAASLIMFTLGTSLFIPSFIFYLFVAFSRVYLGVHFLLDVIVASSVSISIYLLVNLFLNPSKTKIAPKSSNIFRGFLHLSFGLFIMSILMVLSFFSLYPIIITMLVLMLILFVLLFFLHLDFKGRKHPIIHSIIDFVSIRDTFPGESAIWFILGSIILLGFVQDINLSIAALYIVTIGDVASAAFSSSKTSSKGINESVFKNKNIFSFAAFVIFSLPSLIFLGLNGIWMIILAAVIESIDLKVNDNFLILLFLTLSLLLFY